MLAQLVPGEWVVYQRVYAFDNNIVWVMALLTLPILVGFVLVVLALRGHEKILRGVVLTNQRLFVVDAQGRVRQIVLHELRDIEAVRNDRVRTGQGVLANAAANRIVGAFNSAADRHPKTDARYWSPAIGFRVMTASGGVDAVLPPTDVAGLGTRVAAALQGGAAQMPAVDASALPAQDQAAVDRRKRRHKRWLTAAGAIAAVMVLGVMASVLSRFIALPASASDSERDRSGRSEERAEREVPVRSLDGAEQVEALLERRGLEKQAHREDAWIGFTIHGWTFTRGDERYEVRHIDLEEASKQDKDFYFDDHFVAVFREMKVALRPKVLGEIFYGDVTVSEWEAIAEKEGWTATKEKGAFRDDDFGLASYRFTFARDGEEDLVVEVLDLEGFEQHEVHAMHSRNIFERLLVRGEGGAKKWDAKQVAKLPNL